MERPGRAERCGRSGLVIGSALACYRAARNRRRYRIACSAVGTVVLLGSAHGSDGIWPRRNRSR